MHQGWKSFPRLIAESTSMLKASSSGSFEQKTPLWQLAKSVPNALT
jgi:hypothetical protein